MMVTAGQRTVSVLLLHQSIASARLTLRAHDSSFRISRQKID